MCDSLRFTTATAWVVTGEPFLGQGKRGNGRRRRVFAPPTFLGLAFGGIQARGGTRETGMEQRDSVGNEVSGQSRMSHRAIESAEVAGRSVDCSSVVAIVLSVLYSCG